jgi:hypothetical protein
MLTFSILIIAGRRQDKPDCEGLSLARGFESHGFAMTAQAGTSPEVTLKG